MFVLAESASGPAPAAGAPDPGGSLMQMLITFLFHCSSSARNPSAARRRKTFSVA
jgi:hypothetical protein